MEERHCPEVVILITIGPVQEFIAQARKTRDLWFGSHLLSQISKVAADHLQTKGADLIFPNLNENGDYDRLRVSNKILAVTRTDTPKQVVLSVKEAVLNFWKTCTDRVKHELGYAINPAMWKRQVQDFIEFNAVWVEWSDGMSYGEVLQRVEQLIAARKTLRDFRQNDPSRLFGEQKSSLDGGRESVLIPDKSDIYIKYGIKKDERLDAISLVKRLSKYIDKPPAFPSVCDIAFIHFKDELNKNEQLRTAVKGYYETIYKRYSEEVLFSGTGIEDYDSRLFFESRVEDFVEENMKGTVVLTEQRRGEIVQDICIQMQELFSRYKRPSPYYAFVMCDGDKLGEHLRTLDSVDSHKSFSRQLSDFASRAEQIIKKYRGELVYSGGDDVMAYLPLHTCLQTVHELKNEFTVSMEQVISGKRRPTLSVGIAVVHMMERLGEVRRLSLEAERLAKIKRDELAIIVQKRNGSNLMRVSLPFQQNPVRHVLKIQQVYAKGIFSSKLAYVFRRLHNDYHILAGKSAWLADKPSRLRNILIQEAQRLAVKKKPDSISSELLEKEFIQAIIIPAFETNTGPLEQLRLLAEQMIIAVTLAKEGCFDEKTITHPTS